MLTISCHEIQALQGSGTPVICMDVRDAGQHRSLSAGGVVLPAERVAKSSQMLRPYVGCLAVVCAVRPPGRCQRTVLAARELRKMGFTDVRELEGGILHGWINPLGKSVKMPGYPQPSPTQH